MVRMTLGALALFVAVCGVSSFVLLGVAIGTDYWYLIDVAQRENISNLSLNSHSGLWRTCNSQNLCQPFVNPFEGGQNLTDSYRQLLNMHGTFMVLLPLSMIIMVVGGLMGFIGLLARAYLLLLMTGVLLLLGALSSLTGVSVYMAYSAAVFQEALCLAEQMGVNMEGVQILFGWSLVLSWISSGTQLFTSAGFLLACRTITTQRQELKL
ncbi:transmembrane protein 114 isoform X1 [Oncorhynchus tshawytscha]|nr:transmembrane protein 114 isoform X1 [Oncorhynchus tshawytscha]